MAQIAHRHMIAGYVSIGSEVDPAGLLQLIEQAGHQIALPYLGECGAAMIFRCWKTGDLLEPSAYGFLQPLQSAAETIPDIILTPLVGFDDNLARLGQGAGHYDQYFSLNIKSLRIGLAYSCQKISALPCDDWDIPLDAILTEHDLITGPHSRINL